MKYRGFIITSCVDNFVEHEDDKGFDQICNGYYCQVYSADDDQYANQIDDFFLAQGYEIENMSDDALNKGIAKRVDDMYRLYVSAMEIMVLKRTEELLGRTLCLIREMSSGSDLYKTLSEVIGLTDIEMHRLGFEYLSEHFDSDGFAQTIADYLIEKGTEETTSGNYRFEYGEINKRFCVELPDDKVMLDKLISQLTSGENSLIVSDINMDVGIELTFNTLYCPNVEAEINEDPIQCM